MREQIAGSFDHLYHLFTERLDRQASELVELFVKIVDGVGENAKKLDKINDMVRVIMYAVFNASSGSALARPVFEVAMDQTNRVLEEGNDEDRRRARQELRSQQTHRLCVASYCDEEDKVKEILEAAFVHPSTRVDFETTSVRGRWKLSSIHLAAMRGHARVVNLLLENDASPDEADSMGRTALHHAAAHSHHDLVNQLLSKHEVFVNPVDKNGETPLSRAAELGHIDVVYKLLEYDARADLRNNFGHTALDLANRRIDECKGDKDDAYRSRLQLIVIRLKKHKPNPQKLLELSNSDKATMENRESKI